MIRSTSERKNVKNVKFRCSTADLGISGRNRYIEEGIETQKPTFETVITDLITTMSSLRYLTTSEQQIIDENARRADYIYTLADYKFVVLIIDSNQYKAHWDHNDKVFYYVAPYFKWEQTHEAGCRCKNCARVKTQQTTVCPEDILLGKPYPAKQIGRRTPQAAPSQGIPQTINRRNLQAVSATRKNRRSKSISNHGSRHSSVQPADIPYSPRPIASPEPGEIEENYWGNFDNPDWNEPKDNTTTRELDPFPKVRLSTRNWTTNDYYRNTVATAARIKTLYRNHVDITPTLPNADLVRSAIDQRTVYHQLLNAEEILDRVDLGTTKPGSAHREWAFYIGKCEHHVPLYSASHVCNSCTDVELRLDNPATTATF